MMQDNKPVNEEEPKNKASLLSSLLEYVRK
nr:MAG TPA: hypothetical protein [Caudoviricetes sp.]